ncbi:MAG: hypothetical protein WCI41_03590 [bacterium]
MKTKETTLPTLPALKIITKEEVKKFFDLFFNSWENNIDEEIKFMCSDEFKNLSPIEQLCIKSYAIKHYNKIIPSINDDSIKYNAFFVKLIEFFCEEGYISSSFADAKYFTKENRVESCATVVNTVIKPNKVCGKMSVMMFKELQSCING